MLVFMRVTVFSSLILRRLSLLALAFLAGCGPESPPAGNGVVITPLRVVYERPAWLEPEANKRQVTVTFPQVRAATPELARRIEAALDFQLLGLELDEAVFEDTWLVEAGYEAGPEIRGLLPVTLSVEGSAAYPSTLTRRFVVDLATGARLRLARCFTDVAALVERVRALQKTEMEAARLRLRRPPGPEEDADALRWAVETLAGAPPFEADDEADFTISETGITFHHDYGFPHAIQALQPDGVFFLPWQEIQPLMNADGPLARFVRG